MLADLWEQNPNNNFMTADALGIEQDVYNALVKTLVLFESDQVRWFDPDESEDAWEGELAIPKFSGLFNMNQWKNTTKCGTVACIGGTAELIGNLTRGDLGCHRNMALRSLFYPYEVEESRWDDIKVHEAAKALRNYLEGGHPNWRSAMDKYPDED